MSKDQEEKLMQIEQKIDEIFKVIKDILKIIEDDKPNSMKFEDRYITVKDMQYILGVTRRSVYRLFEKGVFTKYTIGRNIYVDRAELDNYVKSNIDTKI